MSMTRWDSAEGCTHTGDQVLHMIWDNNKLKFENVNIFKTSKCFQWKHPCI